MDAEQITRMNDVPQPLIRIRGLTKRYGHRVILDNIDLDVFPGQTLALIGPSGGGKSTLLRCMNALTAWEAGTVEVDGVTIDASAPKRAFRAAGERVRRIVGMVFQDFALFPHRVAIDNVIEGPVQVLGQPPAAARERAMKLLERVGLGDRANHFPDQLSGGQKQRVAMARAMAMNPRALLCDEVTSALDPELKHEVLEVVEDLQREGMTLVMVTHEIGFARKAADRVIVLAGGKIIEDGPPEIALDNPKSERTRQFLSRVMG